LPEIAYQESLDALTEAVAGTQVEVTWTGPDNQNDFVAVAVIGSKPGEYLSYQYTKSGNPVRLNFNAVSWLGFRGFPISSKELTGIEID
jgi:hypothetical protein